MTSMSGPDLRAGIQVPAADVAAAADGWQSLARGDSAEALQAWLSVLVRRSDAEAGFLVLGPADTGPFRPVASVPTSTSMSVGVSQALDHALGERRPIVKSGFVDAGVTSCAVAVPVFLDAALHGVLVLRLKVRAQLNLRGVLEEAEWAIPAVRTRLMALEAARDTTESRRARAALEMLATTLDQPRFRVAAGTAATELADRLNCDRVSLGIRRRRRTRVIALSHSGGFSRKAELMQRVADAMDEATDQGATLIWPSVREDALVVSAAHAALAGTSPRSVATIPLSHGDRIVGAVTLERPADRPFSEEEIELAEVAAGFLGPVLEDRRLNDRGLLAQLWSSLREALVIAFGPSRPALKLFIVLLAGALFWAFNTDGVFRVTADARVEGSVRRVVAAPIDGYVASAAVRPGDLVTEGQVLATLDDRDIALDLKRWETIRAQRQREYETALSDRDRASLGIVATQIGQADAEIALLKERLARTRLTAPFDGVVLSGDLDQSVGAPVNRGHVLYEVAPLDGVRVILSVPEREIAEMSPDLPGELILTSLPGRSYSIETGRVTSVASVEDGENTFRVEASLDETADELRPGMQGLAKIAVDERPVAEIWTRDVLNWLRLTFWRWVP